MAFLPDRFIRKADPDLFQLKCMIDGGLQNRIDAFDIKKRKESMLNRGCQNGYICRNINSLISEKDPADYEDMLTSVCYGLTFDELMNRSIFAPPIAARKIRPVQFPYKPKIYRSSVQNTPFFHEAQVLDAPGILQDFYSSPLSCHPKIPTLFAAALGSSVYIAHTRNKGAPQAICDFTNNANMQPTTVKWANQNVLAIGTRNGSFQCYDMTMERLFRKTYTHTPPDQNVDWHVSAIAVRGENDLVVGNNVSDLLEIDLRASKSQRMNLNMQAICSIACQGNILLAGCNDNAVQVYDTRFMRALEPLYSLPHKAAVRALSFLPGNRNACITGGGMADRTVRLYDVTHGSLIYQVNVETQISNLIALADNTVISTQGHCGSMYSQGILQWQYQEGDQGRHRLLPKKLIETLPRRILFADRCADDHGADSFLTASSDETIRLWTREANSKENDDEAWLNTQTIR